MKKRERVLEKWNCWERSQGKSLWRSRRRWRI